MPRQPGLHYELVLIDQSHLRQRLRELQAPDEQSLARLLLELLNGLLQISAHSAFQSTRSRVLDTTYFFAALIVWAKGSIHSGLTPAGAGDRHAASIIS